MTAPRRREIRAQRRDKEMFKHFGWGTDMPSEDEAPAEDDEQGREFDITEPDSRVSGPARPN